MNKNHRKTVIGVIGSWSATEKENGTAHEIGRLIAKEKWVTLSGGQPAGIMDAVSKGAKEEGGFVIGILPRTEKGSFSDYLDVPIFTDMGHGRNYMNVLSSNVLIVCSKLSAGTMSEASMTLVVGKPIVVLSDAKKDQNFLKERDGDNVYIAKNPADAIKICKRILKK